MFQKIIYGFIGDHHKFRHMTFDELSEIYASMMLRSLAMGMAGIFIPVYLYQHGYPIWEIFVFYSLFFLLGFCFSRPVAYLIAAIGPKHTILTSYIVQIFAMLSLVYIDSIGHFYLTAFIFAFANTSFFTSLHVDFSKVKHKKKSGGEVGWLVIADRAGAISGPLAGGLIAYLFDPKYTFVTAMAVLILAVVPLMFTREPVKTRQKLSYEKMKIGQIKRDIFSYGAFTIEGAVTMVVWPLFVGVIVFKDHPYLQLGVIMSAAIVVSLLLIRFIGKVIDNKKGRQLLRMNVVINAILHLFRPFTAGFPMALAINMANEGITAAYRMAYFKGMYDAADDHPGFRIVYISTVEMFSMLFRSAFFACCAMLAYLVTVERLYFGVLFAVGAIASLLIMIERYPALNPRRRLL